MSIKKKRKAIAQTPCSNCSLGGPNCPEDKDKQAFRLLDELNMKVSKTISNKKGRKIKKKIDILVRKKDLVCKSWVKKDKEEERIFERGW